MDKVLELILLYTKHNKLIDETFINKIVSLIIDIKNLNDYVFKVELSSFNKNEMAVYLSEEKAIKIYIDKVLMNINSQKINQFDESILLKNLLITQIILHELEHAYQWKIMDTENSMEAFILNASSGVSPSKTLKLYEIIPNERFAEIKFHIELQNIIKPINQEITLIDKFIYFRTLEKYFRGYHYICQKITSPLIAFFIESNKVEELNYLFEFDEYKKILNKESYSLKKRMEYGFPITKSEYKKIGRKIILKNK